MPFYLYAEKPVRRLRQILMDVAVLAWVWWSVAVAGDVYNRINGTGNNYGDRIDKMGTTVVDRVNDTAETAGGVPLVGRRLADQIRKLTGIGNDVRDISGDVRNELHQMAVQVSFWLATLLILLVVIPWLKGRLHYALVETRRIAKAERGSADSIQRLALMALVNCDARRVSRVHPNAMQAWRDGDEEVMKGLAALELDRVGLKLKGVQPGRTRRFRKKNGGAAQATATGAATVSVSEDATSTSTAPDPIAADTASLPIRHDVDNPIASTDESPSTGASTSSSATPETPAPLADLDDELDPLIIEPEEPKSPGRKPGPLADDDLLED